MPSFRYINEAFYTEILSHSDWYLRIKDFLTEHFWEFNTNRIGKPQAWFEESHEFNLLVLKLLKENKIPLNTFKLGLDKNRKPIETIVIHHTSREAEDDIDITEEALSLIRIYAKDFANMQNRYYGKPITSDHLYKGKITFNPYHYVIWPDGKVINYLEDSAVGKHCGNYEYNCKSIAICFHDDLENKAPSEKAIITAREIISRYKVKEILGHREISSSTTCPGNLFLGKNGWKNLL